jgi:putative FmdB family regulatory protein
MPTYEYACRDCGEHLEVVQGFKDQPLTECGRCDGTLRKVFSAAGIIFKGSGYYVTDSRKAAGGPSGGSTSSDSDSSSSSDSSSDSGSTKSTKDTSTSTPTDSSASSA